jgi:mannose-1-phosphate guanylyltransferase
MEKTALALVAGPLDVGWSDVGAWSAVARAAPPDCVEIDARGNVIMADGVVVGVLGAEDLVVVATKDAVLVAKKDRAEDVKKIVEAIKARGRPDLL